MIANSGVSHGRPVYARCPACHFVTASLWEVGEGDRGGGSVVGCAYCANEHRVERDQTYGLGALIRHSACGTTVACPAEAHVVRCHSRQPDSAACGDLFTGPAAVSPPTSPGAAEPPAQRGRATADLAAALRHRDHSRNEPAASRPRGLASLWSHADQEEGTRNRHRPWLLR